MNHQDIKDLVEASSLEAVFNDILIDDQTIGVDLNLALTEVHGVRTQKEENDEKARAFVKYCEKETEFTNKDKSKRSVEMIIGDVIKFIEYDNAQQKATKMGERNLKILKNG